MEITIKDRTYKVKYSIRCLFVFEQLTGNTFKLEKLMDEYVLFYAMILANNPDTTLTFNDFIDECDDNPSLVIKLQQYITEVFAMQSQLLPDKEGDSKKVIAISELYSIIVVGCGIQPDYFLDRMQWYEAEACLQGLEDKNKVSWEQTRFISYVTAQVNSTKKLKPTDILSFTWDKPEEASKETIITNEDIQRLKDKANETLTLLQYG